MVQSLSRRFIWRHWICIAIIPISLFLVTTMGVSEHRSDLLRNLYNLHITPRLRSMLLLYKATCVDLRSCVRVWHRKRRHSGNSMGGLLWSIGIISETIKRVTNIARIIVILIRSNQSMERTRRFASSPFDGFRGSNTAWIIWPLLVLHSSCLSWLREETQFSQRSAVNRHFTLIIALVSIMQDIVPYFFSGLHSPHAAHSLQ